MQNIEQNIQRLQSLSRGAEKAFNIYQYNKTPRNKRVWQKLEKAYRQARKQSRTKGVA